MIWYDDSQVFTKVTIRDPMSDQIDHLTRALEEIRTNKTIFSKEAYSQIVMALLEKKRRAQTIKSHVATDEIRLVTVMFIDVKDSTELAQELGSGDWKNVIGEAHQRLARLVNQWDGEVGQYLGDGLLCFFGAQKSRGDDAVRAVACALAVQQTMREYGIEIYLRYATEFQVRIGISTGRVAVGMIGNQGKQEFLALGPSTNLASRLQMLAQPGGVLIDEQTFSRVRNHFITTPQHPTRIKGFDEPVSYYSVHGRQTKPTEQLTTHQIAGIELPFIGRKTEKDHILRCWDQATNQSRLRMITLSGDIGLGKSRLLQETINEISKSTPLIQLNMVAHYEHRTVSYNLLRDLLRNQCSLKDDTPTDIVEQRIRDYVQDTWNHNDAEIVAAVMGYITGYGFADHPGIQTLKTEGRKREQVALSWLSRWFQGLAKSSSLLVVVDNVQWVDPASLEMLAHLARDLQKMPVLMLAAGRRGFEMQHPGYRQMFPNHEILSLSTLSQDETRTLIEAVLRYVERVPSTLMPLIQERANGNPLFVQEFLAMLFDNNVFQPVERELWKFNLILYDTVVSKLPDGLMGVMQARLDDLPPEARHILQVASILGPTFWVSALEEMTDVPPRAWLPMLESRGMIIKNPKSNFEGEDQYQFSHTLYRDVSYEMLPRQKREGYHQQFARWLVTRIAEKHEYFPTLAEQFELGGQTEAALFTSLEAVQNRVSRGMLNETQSLIDRGLALASTVPRQAALPVTSQLWTIRGQTLNSMNRFAEASAASESALRLLDELAEDQLTMVRVEANHNLGIAYRNLGQYDEGLHALNEALRWLNPNNLDQKATLMRAFGFLSFYRGDLASALEYMLPAWEAATDSGGNRQITGCMTELGLIAHYRGDFATALSYFEIVLDVNRQFEDMHYQVLDLRNIGAVYLSLFALEEALQTFDEAQSLLHSLQQEDRLLQAYSGLARVMLGDLSAGLEELSAARKIGHPDIFNQQQIQLMMLHALTLSGQFVLCCEEAETYVQHVREYNPILAGRGLLWQGISGHALGDPNALDFLEEALHLELLYGGRDAWLCHHALAVVEDDDKKSSKHLQDCADTLETIFTSLHTRTDLQLQFINNQTIRGILTAAGREVSLSS